MCYTAPMPKQYCLTCTERIAGRSWPLRNEAGEPGVPELPELVDGLCPVCEGSEGMDGEDVE